MAFTISFSEATLNLKIQNEKDCGSSPFLIQNNIKVK